MATSSTSAGDADDGQRPAAPSPEADAGGGEHRQAGAEPEVGGTRQRGEPRRPVVVRGLRPRGSARPGSRPPVATRATGQRRARRRARPRAAARAAYAGVDQRAPTAPWHVEVELDGERPGRADRPEDVVVAVDVGERQVQQQVLPVAGQRRVGGRPDDQHDGEVERQPAAPSGGTAAPSRDGRRGRRAPRARPGARARSRTARRTSRRTARCRASPGAAPPDHGQALPGPVRLFW